MWTGKPQEGKVHAGTVSVDHECPLYIVKGRNV